MLPQAVLYPVFKNRQHDCSPHSRLECSENAVRLKGKQKFVFLVMRSVSCKNTPNHFFCYNSFSPPAKRLSQNPNWTRAISWRLLSCVVRSENLL